MGSLLLPGPLCQAQTRHVAGRGRQQGACFPGKTGWCGSGVGGGGRGEPCEHQGFTPGYFPFHPLITGHH